MLKIALLMLILMPSLAYAQANPRITNEGQHPLRHQAGKIVVDASGFTGNLSGTDTDVQTAFNTVDAMVAGGAADCWEEVGGALTPATVCVADALWELDGNGDLEPKV
jgi:hypothetical protein